MPAIVWKVRYAVKQRLLKNLRPCRPAEVRQRSRIVLSGLNRRSARETAAVLKVHTTTANPRAALDPDMIVDVEIPVASIARAAGAYPVTAW
jgi:hypothetical protein